MVNACIIKCCVYQGEEGGSGGGETKPAANKEHSRAKLQEQDLLIKDLKLQLKYDIYI